MIVTERNGWQVIEVSGEVDISTAPSLRERLVGLIAEGHRRLVIDLDDVGFLDSTGLGVLIGALKRVRTQDGELRLVCSQPRTLKVFEVTRLDAAFDILPSVDEAVKGNQADG